ncbi:class I SAM-dependent methyltransferase [Spirulina subsalsa]|uniref:class I SAM-dependent methyltransferase n=1 Tax=Spirulina subsalsa TaxID=54311 RepID=UPI0002FFD6B1|nr:class I SAM-dependent methyltransferase [Spirulina subsalsa]
MNSQLIEIEAYLQRLYANRFDAKLLKSKTRLWRVLIDVFLQQYIKTDATILDVGGGYCEFINQVTAREKYLVDLNPDAQVYANPDVKVLQVDFLSVAEYLPQNNYFDVIFISNFFEHLATKEELLQVLVLCFKLLKPGGSLLVIQPNFKYAYREYYDFIDHQLPLTHISLQEILYAIGFKIPVLIPRFLPYSTHNAPTSTRLLRLYLNLPIFWSFIGKQMFVKADKPLS